MKESEFLERLAVAESNIANLLERREVDGWDETGQKVALEARCRSDAFTQAAAIAEKFERENGT